MTSLWTLFWVFAKIGGLTFGGGMAMLPLLESEVVNKHHWVTGEELLDLYAIGQCTPGAIAVNTATFIGYRQRRNIGGIVSSLGMIFPSLVLILLLASALKTFAGNVYLQKAFAGIRIVVCALILKACISLFRKSVVDAITLALLAASILANLLLGVSTVWIVIATFAIGVAYHLFIHKHSTKCGAGSSNGPSKAGGLSNESSKDEGDGR